MSVNGLKVASVTRAESDESCEPRRLASAYQVGRALNFLQWLSRTAVADGTPMESFGAIDVVLDKLAPLVITIIPSQAMAGVESQIEASRREWREVLTGEGSEHREWFVEAVSDFHEEFHGDNGTVRVFDVALSWTERPWKQLRRAILNGLHHRPCTIDALHLGEAVDQGIHTPGVVADLLDRAWSKFQSCNCPRSGTPDTSNRRHIGGPREKRRRLYPAFVRAKSKTGLPVAKNWAQRVLAFSTKLGIDPGKIRGSTSGVKAVDRSVMSALEHLGESSHDPKPFAPGPPPESERKTKTKKRRGRKKDPHKPRKDAKIVNFVKDNPGLNQTQAAKRLDCSPSHVSKVLKAARV